MKWATRLALLLAAIACLLVALGCGPEEPAAPDAARTPPRILSLSREVSELLVELGLAPSVVGADHASVALPQLADAADLGDAGASGADAIALAAALRPDLALFLADGEPPFARALEARGIRSYVFAPHSANDVLAAVHRLGAILGDETRTTALAARITSDVSRFATLRDGRARVRVVWLLQRDPPVVVGGVGLLHELLELAGAENAFHGPPDAPTPERLEVDAAQIAASEPDLVLDASGVPDVAPASGVRALVVPPDLASVPALDLAPRVERLHALFYPGESP